MATGKLWTRPELMLAVELYCRTPFGRIHKTNPDIITLANQLARTPSSVGMKMVNFAALDETIEQKGMSNVSVADRAIWSKFFSAPAEFLDRVDSVRQTEFALPEPEERFEVREGLDVQYTAKGRRNQDFFRRAVLAAYDGKCAITGINQPELLVASHIVGWAQDADLRVKPTNGICLNALHDRAFDRHLISFENDCTMIVSKRLKLTSENRAFFENKKLVLPRRFRSDPQHLSRHRDQMLQKDAA
ncbi:MAG: HNH endonuclease [Alphaproteobacteria bacterium]